MKKASGVGLEVTQGSVATSYIAHSEPYVYIDLYGNMIISFTIGDQRTNHVKMTMSPDLIAERWPEMIKKLSPKKRLKINNEET